MSGTEANVAPAGEEPDLPASDGPSQRRRASFVLVTSVAVVLGVLAVVLAVLLVADGSDDDEVTELRRTAGRFAEALVTYDHRAPDEHRDAVLRLATGSFREEYEDAFDEGLSQIITEVEAVSTGFVKDVYLSEIDEGQAAAVVVVDVEHDGAGGPRTLRDLYFRLTLVQVGGEWKIDQVTDLNFGTGPTAGGPDVTSDTTTSTSTSVP